MAVTTSSVVTAVRYLEQDDFITEDWLREQGWVRLDDVFPGASTGYMARVLFNGSVLVCGTDGVAQGRCLWYSSTKEYSTPSWIAYYEGDGIFRCNDLLFVQDSIQRRLLNGIANPVFPGEEP